MLSTVAVASVATSILAYKKAQDSNQVTPHGGITEHSAIYSASNRGHRSYIDGQAGPKIGLSDFDHAARSYLDFRFQARPETYRFAIRLATQVYGREPEHRYFLR